jgi:hypothetical protein
MTQRAGGSIALRPKVNRLLDKIQKAFIGKAGHLEIWHVDGKIIRDQIYIDFTEGGNSRAYVWMPRDTIWIDHDTDPGELQFIMLHELREWNRMGEGVGYDKAHDYANIAEQQARDKPEETGKLWRAEIAAIKPERKGQIS